MDDDSLFGMPGQRFPAYGLLGTVLRGARDERLLSQAALAERVGVAQSVVSRLERGPLAGREPSWPMFCRLVDALDLEPVLTVRKKRSVLDKELDRLQALTPAERWNEQWLGIAGFADALDAVPGWKGGWALDGDAALVGHGAHVLVTDLTVSALDIPAVVETLDGARAATGEAFEVRLRAAVPGTVLLPAGTRSVPVLAIDQVEPSSEDGAAALAEWLAHVSLKE